MAQIIARHRTPNLGTITRARSRQTRRLRLGVVPRFNPIAWALGYPVALATVLISVAALTYLLQVNEASWLQFDLNNASVQQSQLNATNALLLVQKDRLLAEQRIDTIATTKLKMQHPSLDTALWLQVTIRQRPPTVPREPVVRTGPLVWMRHAVSVIENSL